MHRQELEIHPMAAADETLIELTLRAAKRDQQMVTEERRQVRRLTEGVLTKSIPTQVDARGALFELYDPRWNWHPEPLVYSYCFTVRPGRVKGWGLHKEHADRYVLIGGEMKLVLFDPRPESSTYGEICEIWLTESDRQLIHIPRFVWHADHNIGMQDAVVVNFPTAVYDYKNPDKFRLPIDTDLIPYRFDDRKGW
jgi:dTDP-4-dehydrorhamnose 3,5-epimerase